MAGLRDDFLQLVADEGFMRRVLVHSVNGRIQEFADPLTSTLMIMASSPLQLVICEAGLLLFRTSALPVFPFDKLLPAHRAAVLSIVERAGLDGVSEAYHGCGKHTLHVQLGNLPALGKRALLSVFVQAMTVRQAPVADPHIMQQLCNIILQRFLSSVSVPSDDIRVVMQQLWGAHRPAITDGSAI